MYLISALVDLVIPGLIALLSVYALNFLRVVLPKVIDEEFGDMRGQSLIQILNVYKSYLLTSKIPCTFSILIFLVTYINLYIHQAQAYSVPLLLFSYITITLAYIDIDTHLLPDLLTLPLLWLGLLVNASATYSILSLKLAIYGVVLPYILLTIFNWLYESIRGREGMGKGDVKLIAAFGAWFGHQDLLPILLTAFFVHIFSVLIYSRLKVQYADEKPFGPSLILATHIYLLTFLIKL